LIHIATSTRRGVIILSEMFNKMAQRYARLVTFYVSLDVEHIMRLGGWESLDMGLRYTRSVRFEESLRLYRGMEK
jgi:hypothetical protein